MRVLNSLSLFFVLCMGFFLYLEAGVVTEKYPSAFYVLSEFDLDEEYAYNRDFETFVQKHEHALRRFFRKAVSRSEGLLALLRGQLLDDDLSDLFLYMSIVESGLHPRALSSKKAAGLWQFMPATAKAYHLRVGNSCDERCDPSRATQAAIAHLRHLYNRFGKWYLAVLAYNCGEGRLRSAIEKAGTDDIEILLDAEQKFLPKETRDYLNKIILVAMIGESDTIEEGNGIEPVSVEVRPGTDLRMLAKQLKMDASILLRLNPALKNGVVPKSVEHYEIAIPEEKIVRFYLRCNSVQAKLHEPKPFFISHQVVLGETLEQIARHYDTTTEAIRRANHLNSDALELDRLLVIPVSEEAFDARLRKKE